MDMAVSWDSKSDCFLYWFCPRWSGISMGFNEEVAAYPKGAILKNIVLDNVFLCS
jgi:hypothetical protein